MKITAMNETYYNPQEYIRQLQSLLIRKAFPKFFRIVSAISEINNSRNFSGNQK